MEFKGPQDNNFDDSNNEWLKPEAEYKAGPLDDPNNPWDPANSPFLNNTPKPIHNPLSPEERDAYLEALALKFKDVPKEPTLPTLKETTPENADRPQAPHPTSKVRRWGQQNTFSPIEDAERAQQLKLEAERKRRAIEREAQRIDNVAKHKENLLSGKGEPYEKADLSLFKARAARSKIYKQPTPTKPDAKLLKQFPGIQTLSKPPALHKGTIALGKSATQPKLSQAIVAGSGKIAPNTQQLSQNLLEGSKGVGQKPLTQQQPETPQTPSALFPVHPKVTLASTTLNPGMLAQAIPKKHLQPQSNLSASPVENFQQTLNRNAQNILQQNRTRLDQSQQRFADLDPKNPNWATLRQHSTYVAKLMERTQSAKLKLLEVYRAATGDRVSSPFPLLDTETSPEGRRELMLAFYQKQLGPSWTTLAPRMLPFIDQYYVADSLQAGMFAQEPALGILTTGEVDGPNTLENNRHLQKRIVGGFDVTRNSIGKLEQALQTDPESAIALKFDSVVEQTLAGIKAPKQRHQVLAWVQQKQQAERDQQLKGTMGLAATTVGALGASAFGVGALALIFGGAGALLGGKMSLDGIVQAGTNLDAVQAGGAGGQKLTAMNPYQARMDYQMAIVNVGLTLLDAGVAVSSIRKVLGSQQAVQALTKLKPNQVEQFAEATKLQRLGKTAEAKKALQKFLSQSPELSESEVETLTSLASRKSSIFHEQWNAEVKAYFDKYYGQVGRKADDVEDLVTSSRRKGIKVKEGDDNKFNPDKKSKGTITYSSGGEMPIKRWSYKEEFLHSLVAQAKQRLRKVQPQISRMETANLKAAQAGLPLPYTQEQIEQLVPRSIREMKGIEAELKRVHGGRRLKGDDVAAEEIFVKEWLLKHPKLGEVGDAERILLETQIRRLRQHGVSHGY